MNPELPKNPHDELEAHITALLLGELSAYESEAVREAIAKDPALTKLNDELKRTIHLVRESVQTSATEKTTPADQPKLSDERREKLLAQFKTIQFPERVTNSSRVWGRLVGVLAVMAIAAILAAMMLPALSKSKSRAQSASVMSNLRQLDAAKQQWALDNNKPAEASPSFEDIKPYLGRGAAQEVMPPVAGEKYVLGKVGEPNYAEFDASRANRISRTPAKQFANIAPDQRVRLSDEGKWSVAKDAQVGLAGRVWSGDNSDRYPMTVTATPQATGGVHSANVVGYANVRGYYDENGKNADTEDKKHSPVTITGIPAAAPVPQIVLPNSGLSAQAPITAADGVELHVASDQVRSGGNRAVSLADAPSAGYLFQGASEKTPQQDRAAWFDWYLGNKLKGGNTVAGQGGTAPATRERGSIYSEEAIAGGNRKALDIADLKIEATATRKSSINAPIPQPEFQTSENNFSTFSLNVSDVSFKLAAASLEKGQMPDAASIRSEEFINAFDYRDPEATANSPVAFAWERARYPFAHNRDLLRFSIKTAAQGRQAGRPLNLVLLLDNSGSMERADRVRIIREALRVLATQLQPQDRVSVVTFARTARLIADGVAGDKAHETFNEVSGLTPEGGTNLEDAMNLAYQTASSHFIADGINRVVLLTDGAANLGDVAPESLKQKVETHRKQGIALDCFGIGWEGFNDDLLEVLSRNGDGRYGFINSPEEAATEFAGQLAGALKVAASDVKVQVEFNPRRVTSYRQIGYAKHQLTKEQFRDNTVDAAEIAAQEAGNALYTIETNPGGSGPICTVRVRYKIPGTSDYREQSRDVPYTGNAVALEQASPAMRLAASASAFSEWLVASPFANEVSPDQLLNLLRGVPETYGADPRAKKLEWMIRQAKSIEGK